MKIEKNTKAKRFDVNRKPKKGMNFRVENAKGVGHLKFGEEEKLGIKV